MKINAASASSDSDKWKDVNETTFAAMRINDVTAANLSAVQYYLEISATPYPRTVAQIQAIVDETIQEMMVNAIYAYLTPLGGGFPPTIEVFARAGITGVDASNLATILDELSWAYQEAKNNPFGTPMSTKQDIQDVVDFS